MSNNQSKSFFTTRDIFESTNKERIPKIDVAPDGTILAFSHKCRRLRRSEDCGETWLPVQENNEVSGNLVVDEAAGDVLLVRLVIHHNGAAVITGKPGGAKRLQSAPTLRVTALPGTARRRVPARSPG